MVCEKKLSARATSLFVKRRTSFLQEDALWNSKISLPGTWNNSTKKKKNELTQSEKNLFVILHGRWKPHQEMHTKYSSSFTVKPNLFSPFTLKYKSSIAFHFVLTVNVKEVAYLETCILLEKKKEVRFRKQLFPRNMSGARQACGFWEIHGCTKGYAPGFPWGIVLSLEGLHVCWEIPPGKSPREIPSGKIPNPEWHWSDWFIPLRMIKMDQSQH